MVGRSEGCWLSVALRKESVDRNFCKPFQAVFGEGSLSARRAWIEMDITSILPQPNRVALRKESVDRNLQKTFLDPYGATSLSARRAWIEIVITAMTSQISVVALRKESVDRNQRIAKPFREQFSRSPQGERG